MKMIKIAFPFTRSTSNIGTVENWKVNGIAVEEIRQVDPKTEKITLSYRRPPVELNLEVPTVDELINDESGKGLIVLEKLIQQLATEMVRIPVELNKNVEDYPEITAASLYEAQQEPVKLAALKATKEEMEAAADLFAQFMEQSGKIGANAKMQIDQFKSKFAVGKLDKMATTFYNRGADRNQVLEIGEAIKGNVANFLDFIEEQEEDIRLAGVTPAKICINAIEGWLKTISEPEETEDLLDIENF